MYIGEEEIKITTPDGDNSLKLDFADKSSTIINKDLYELVSSKEKGSGNITDNINHYFAKKFVAELSVYDLEFYFANSVSASMGVLAHNLREELLKKTFDCSGGDSIRLKLLIDNVGNGELDKKK